jgi:hypothetical protein
MQKREELRQKGHKRVKNDRFERGGEHTFRRKQGEIKKWSFLIKI